MKCAAMLRRCWGVSRSGALTGSLVELFVERSERRGTASIGDQHDPAGPAASCLMESRAASITTRAPRRFGALANLRAAADAVGATDRVRSAFLPSLRRALKRKIKRHSTMLRLRRELADVAHRGLRPAVVLSSLFTGRRSRRCPGRLKLRVVPGERERTFRGVFMRIVACCMWGGFHHILHCAASDRISKRIGGPRSVFFSAVGRTFGVWRSGRAWPVAAPDHVGAHGWCATSTARTRAGLDQHDFRFAPILE